MISITNDSPDYLIFSSITIPFQPGGTVVFTGPASAADATKAGITLKPTGAGAPPTVTIDEIYPNTVSNSPSGVPVGPAVYFNTDVNNLGGQVTITNFEGSVGLLGTINALGATVTAPNGVFIVSAPGVDFQGATPYSEWASEIVYPGGNPNTGTGAVNADAAVAWAANALYNFSGNYSVNNGDKYTTNQAFNPDALYLEAGDAANSTSEVFYGGDVPWDGNITHDGSKGTAQNLSPIGQSYAISGSASGNEGYFPMVPVEPLTYSASLSQADQGAGATPSSIHAAQILIHAQTIDLDSAVTVGQPNAYSVNLPATLGSTIAFDKYLYSLGAPAIYTLPAYPVAAGDSTVGVQYDAQTNQILVSDVSASSGGGALDLQGAIMNTNTLGNIHVNGGLGAVTIDNSTGIPLVVHNVSAGSSAVSSLASGTVDIIDTNQPAASEQTLYIYHPGTGIDVYRGTASQSEQDLLATAPIRTTSGTSESYSPETGLRWQWQLAAVLERDIFVFGPDNAGLTAISSSHWTFEVPPGELNADNPWEYIDNGDFSTNPGNLPDENTGNLIVDTGLPDFYETITALAADSYNVPVEYHNGNYGFTFASPTDWNYQYFDELVITLTNSVKADNPIGIDFSGLTTGEVNIDSNAPVILTGDIVNPSGNTTITARGSITNTPTASLQTNNLSLSASGGSSTVQVMPAGATQLWTTASGGSFTLSVTFDGQTETTALLAYNASAPAIQAALDGLTGVNANVTGQGTAVDPWLITGVSGLAANDQELTGGSSFVTSVPTGQLRLWNNAEGGTFAISVTQGGATETTAPINYNASAGAVADALDQLSGVEVTVTGAGTAASPWVISGLGSSATLSTDDAGLSYATTVHSAPAGAQELYNSATGGTFTISAVVGSTTEVTGPLDYNTTAGEVAAALNALSGVQVTVTGGGTASDPWIISGTGYSSLSADDSSLTTNIQAPPAGTSALYNSASGGTFTITAKVNGNAETTGSINYNATAGDVQTALNMLAGVTATVTGNGTAADPWLISGTGVSSLSVTDSLTPSGQKSTRSTVPSGAQQMSISGSGGAFIIQMTVGGQTDTASLPANATAAQVQAALNAMDPSVQAAVTGLGTTTDPWLISGTNVSTISFVSFGLSGGSSTLTAVLSGAAALQQRRRRHLRDQRHRGRLDRKRHTCLQRQCRRLCSRPAWRDGDRRGHRRRPLAGERRRPLQYHDQRFLADRRQHGPIRATHAPGALEQRHGRHVHHHGKRQRWKRHDRHARLQCNCERRADRSEQPARRECHGHRRGHRRRPLDHQWHRFQLAVHQCLAVGRQQHDPGCSRRRATALDHGHRRRLHDPDDRRGPGANGHPRLQRHRRYSAGCARCHGPERPGRRDRQGTRQRSVAH